MTLDILVKNVAVWSNEGLCDLEIAGGHFVSIGLGTTSPRQPAVTLDARAEWPFPDLSNHTFIWIRR
jgi:hypothetical protein